eukprot:c19218_g1_i4 orf=588-977(+)
MMVIFYALSNTDVEAAESFYKELSSYGLFSQAKAKEIPDRNIVDARIDPRPELREPKAAFPPRSRQKKTWRVQREQSGPGSKPPLCTSKCGKCTPCTPTRVPVQPGTPRTAEYYPEAWRCKCGGNLYMP